MKQYDSDKLKEIEDSVNLVDYIGQQIELTKRGDDFFGTCPLHVDETPSFSVNEDKNFFYCFSCHRGGKIISFLMEYEGLSFVNAVEKASKLANVEIESRALPDSLVFLKSVRNRKVKNVDGIHEIFPMEDLEKYNDEPAQEWIDEGIPAAIQKKYGVRIDNKSNRIIYPVFDVDGNLINIKGRTRMKNFKDLKIPKYISWYPIGKMDYFQGWQIAEPAIRAKKEVILFESIKSVMKMCAWGYENCVSIESHGITKEQIKILIKSGAAVVLAFDSDIDIYDKNSKSLRSRIKMLKNFVPVYLIEDNDGILGGKDGKNSPADLGKDVWDKLYSQRYKL